MRNDDTVVTMSRRTIIRMSTSCGLAGLRAAIALATTTYSGDSCASLSKLGTLAQMERHSLRKHLDRLITLGFVRETRQTRSKRWWCISQPTDDLVEIARCTVANNTILRDGLALGVLLKSLGTESGEFLISFDLLAELAKCSRDTLDRKWRLLEKAGWVARERRSRSDYCVRINVPAGTTATFTEVRRTDSIGDMRARALAILKGEKS